ncbi:MAG TPA: hypothetical protein VHO50_12060 [Bacteroidales bacterium]|nr:hypothetical protein [Bacteroidales bacterium]
MNFILTIDTAADNQWATGKELTLENIRNLPRLQKLCDKYHIKPTYMLASETCEDSFSREMFSDFLENDQAEVGALLNPWTTPPFFNRDGLRYNDIRHAFPNEISEDIVANKIRYLTDQIRTTFSIRPTSFRAGRFGFSENIARILMVNEYMVDSSITPFVNWSGYVGIPGFRGGPDYILRKPYPFTYNHKGNSLLEIPLTVLPTRFPLNKNRKITDYYFNNVNRNIVLKGLRSMFYRYQPLWLRPYPWMTIDLLDEVTNEALSKKLPYIVMVFFSGELTPACSIYRSDNEATENMFDLLENFFNLLAHYHIGSVTLTEAAKKYELVTGTTLSYKYV